jgi:hypothetical protein
MTPASVACTPDLSTQTHITRPVSTYAAVLVTPARFMAISTTTATAAIDERHPRETARVEQRDDHDRAEIVEHGQSSSGTPSGRAERVGPNSDSTAERESDVGRRRDRPAAVCRPDHAG